MTNSIYRYRSNLLSRTAIVELQDDSVSIRSDSRGQSHRSIEYRNVRLIKEIVAGVGGDQLGENRFHVYQMTIVPLHGRPIRLKSASFVGVGSKRAFHGNNQLDEYRAFANRLKANVAASNPSAEVRSGSRAMSVVAAIFAVVCCLLLTALQAFVFVADKPVMELAFAWLSGTTMLLVAASIFWSMFKAYAPEAHRITHSPPLLADR